MDQDTVFLLLDPNQILENRTLSESCYGAMVFGLGLVEMILSGPCRTLARMFLLLLHDQSGVA